MSAQPTRPDVTINARPGFLEVTRRRLADILVKSGTRRSCATTSFTTSRTRRTSADTLQKSVLSAVALWSSETNPVSELYRHTFEYNKAPATTAMFSPQEQWGQMQQSAGPQGGYVPRDADGGLSQSDDEPVGGERDARGRLPGALGHGQPRARLGFSSPNLALLGLTGEGLPDQVDKNGTLTLNTRPAVQATDHFSGGPSHRSDVISATRSHGIDGGRQPQRPRRCARGGRQLRPARGAGSRPDHGHQRRRLP